LLPWLTDFEQLKSLGGPESKEGEQRDDLRWGDETILGGVPVTLIVARWKEFGDNFRLEDAHGYISESDYELLKARLPDRFGSQARRSKPFGGDVRYTWVLDRCKVILVEGDHWGPSWMVVMKYRYKWKELFGFG
ncbi:MAG TPA: hypothetical protein PK760_01365, partial [Flavobacteriales bacterium]|nr:hypothetical protein [Flavobacteriales bacterium]